MANAKRICFGYLSLQLMNSYHKVIHNSTQWHLKKLWWKTTFWWKKLNMYWFKISHGAWWVVAQKKYHSTKHQKKTCQMNTDRTRHYINILMLGETIYSFGVNIWSLHFRKQIIRSLLRGGKISSEICANWKNGSVWMFQLSYL